MIKLLIIFFAVLFTQSAYSQWSDSAELGANIQIFEDDNDDLTRDSNYYFKARLGVAYEGSFDAKVNLFTRQDWAEPEDSFFNLQEAWIQKRKDFYQLKLGFEIFNWSVLEAFHPVDVINSRDFNSDIDNFQKLGEPTVSLRLNYQKNYLHLYYFPYFISPEFPYKNSRFNLIPSSVEIGISKLVTSDGKIESLSQSTQYAIKYDRKFKNMDLSFYFMNHIDRQQPGFFVDLTTSTLHPTFFHAQQWGGTLVYVFENFLFKSEVAIKKYQEKDALVLLGGEKKKDDNQYAIGIEIPYDLSNGMELTTFLEYQSIPNFSNNESSSFVPFQNDLFLAWRLAFNDIPGQELKLTAIWDLDNSRESLISATYERRIRDNWKLKTGYRLISAPPDDKNNKKGLEVFNGTNYLTIGLTRFF